MEITGEYPIPASRQRVWDALNDPEVLKACIPGCDELVCVSPTEFTARLTSQIGAIRTRLTGRVTLSDLDPPSRYRITGEGQGGIAGFVRGSALVSLAEEGDATVLRYTAKADVGGKLASVGSRVIQAVARKMADDFFRTFAEKVGASPLAATAAAAETPGASRAT